MWTMIKRTSASFILLFLCYSSLLTDAINDTDVHSNQTEVETVDLLTTTIHNLTEEVSNVNVTIIPDEPVVSNTTEDATTAALDTFNTTVPPSVISTEASTTPTTIDITTVVSTIEAEVMDLNCTQESLQLTTEETIENQTMEVTNTSCSLSKWGCCADGITARNSSGDEGCSEIDATTVITVVNTTAEKNNDTESTTMTSTRVTTEAITVVSNSTVHVSVEAVFNTTADLVQETSTESVVEQSTDLAVETTTKKEEEATTVAVAKTCAETQYECCPDGITPAKGPQFDGCETTEKWMPNQRNISLQTVCELEKDAGTCSKYVNMWAYDRQQGKCIRFWYGGCEGNANRFETEQQCQETCVNPKGIEVCLLPKVTGPCHSNSERYYYDREKKECQQFHYGGCNGNGNNYDTLEKCQANCEQEVVDRCTQPVASGPCKGEFVRYFYDTTAGQCRTFTYGGCQKNQNHFVTLKECLNACVVPRERDICLQPKIIGTCQERRPTWYFDMVAQECKLFHYSGCKGNQNRFSTKEECDLSCASFITSKTLKEDRKALCRLPMTRGDCDQQIVRWYYNPLDEFCHSFHYTGCHGNANSFETEQDCRESCEAKERDICTLDKDSGTCDQYRIMWYFDSLSKQCKNFYYGSCGGNGNRFVTEQECQLRCLIKAGNSTCSQKVDPGYACNSTNQTESQPTGSLMKFFFDQQLNKCSSFLYQGCGGNDNRFDEENRCIEKCVTETPVVEQSCGSNMIRCNIQCRFGFERDGNGCEICRCFEPCQRQQCPSGYACVIIPEQVPCLQAPCPVPRVECQPANTDQAVNPEGGMKPLIENSITNIFSQFDANVTIPCSLRQGYPQPVIYWYKERQQLQVHEAMANGLIVRKIERLPDQSLLIRKITLEDQGLYTCRAINEYGQDIKDVQLEIFDPIKVDIYPINRVYQLGFTAKLQCRATGYPLPRVTWMREHAPLVNTTRITLQNDGSLIIHPYKPEDAGPYVCNATNKKETVTQVAYLEVKETRVEPTCEDQPTFANCELVLRHNFCDVYFDYCCRTCSQHGPPPTGKTPIRNRRHVLV